MPASTKKTIISLLADHAQKKRILVVGHEPELGLAISALIGAETPALELKKGGIVRVDFDDFLKEHKGTLIYSLPPKILRMAGKKQPHK
jgi:phosphohistidine phosphatase SixA